MLWIIFAIQMCAQCRTEENFFINGDDSCLFRKIAWNSSLCFLNGTNSLSHISLRNTNFSITELKEYRDKRIAFWNFWAEYWHYICQFQETGVMSKIFTFLVENSLEHYLFKRQCTSYPLLILFYKLWNCPSPFFFKTIFCSILKATASNVLRHISVPNCHVPDTEDCYILPNTRMETPWKEARALT